MHHSNPTLAAPQSCAEFLQLLPLGATRWFSGHLVTRHDADAYEVGSLGHYTFFTAAQAAKIMEA